VLLLSCRQQFIMTLHKGLILILVPARLTMTLSAHVSPFAYYQRTPQRNIVKLLQEIFKKVTTQY